MTVADPARPWSAGDLAVLECCATIGLPTLVIALKLGRRVEAVRGKAAETGVALDGDRRHGNRGQR